ncbi:MAG: outer membrane beta-barrel protein [Planctomycetia bacterium]|nr:outer membrane beta-barrel protein [Planctomycetia bacterium]
MKKTFCFRALLTAVAVLMVTFAFGQCDTCTCTDACGNVVSCQPKPLIEFSGYANAGYYGNTVGSDFNGNSNTWSHSGGALNAIYASMTKKADTGGCGVDWGFGADLMFGEDYRFMHVEEGLDEKWNTASNNSYGFAMPQLYAEIAMNYWNVKMGHIYTPFGYEGAKATDRFFYSRGQSFDVLPVTQTGAWATYNGFENLEIGMGWFNGINQGFDDSNGGSMGVLSLKYQMTDRLALKYVIGSGDIYDYEIGGARVHTYGILNFASLEWKISPCFTAVTTFDYQDRKGPSHETVLVLGQHLYRDLTEKLKLGLRMEWERQRDLEANVSTETYNVALGANWKPLATECFLIRPEVRYDHCSAAIYGENNDKDHQVCLGVDMLFRF